MCLDRDAKGGAGRLQLETKFEFPNNLNGKLLWLRLKHIHRENAKQKFWTLKIVFASYILSNLDPGIESHQWVRSQSVQMML